MTASPKKKVQGTVFYKTINAVCTISFIVCALSCSTWAAMEVLGDSHSTMARACSAFSLVLFIFSLTLGLLALAGSEDEENG